MNFFKKLFGKKEEQPAPAVVAEKDPDNARLNYLLNNYGEYPSDENYKAVFNELMTGNCFLMLPTVDGEEQEGASWKTTEAETTIKLTSVFDIHGLQVLGAFTTEQALIDWSKRKTVYLSVKAPAVMELCRQQNIGRVVINSNRKDMFVLERDTSNITTTTIDKDTPVQVGMPAQPLKEEIIALLVENFKKISTIEEVYQFGMVRENEASIVIAVKLTEHTEDAVKAVNNAINDTFRVEQPGVPVDVMYLDSPEWLNTARGVKDSLFYARVS